MLFCLDEDYEALRELTAQVADEQLVPRAAAVDDTGQFPAESLKAVVSAELHAVGLPEAYGGQGASLLGSVVVAEQLARGCATTQQIAGGLPQASPICRAWRANASPSLHRPAAVCTTAADVVWSASRTGW